MYVILLRYAASVNNAAATFIPFTFGIPFFLTIHSVAIIIEKYRKISALGFDAYTVGEKPITSREPTPIANIVTIHTCSVH